MKWYDFFFFLHYSWIKKRHNKILEKYVRGKLRLLDLDPLKHYATESNTGRRRRRARAPGRGRQAPAPTLGV